jgi:RNA polymerase sigma-70 factor (ECF subfamily)
MYARKMMGVCLWYSWNREEAEEILQDGFLRVFTYIGKYRHDGPLENWIRKIMVNAALLRFKSKHPPLTTPVEAIEVICPDRYSHVYAILEEKELLKIVQSLPPSYQMVFNLHVLEGLKHREIASMLGISEGTSKSNLFAARAFLQKLLLSEELDCVTQDRMEYEEKNT